MLLGVVASQVQPVAEVVASGGTVTEVTISGLDYRVHTFAASGNFVLADAAGQSFDVLLVAGGGSGGTGGSSTYGAGGGGGGVLQLTGISLSPATFAITVGAGGTPIAAGVNNTRGNTGGDS